MNAGVHRVTRDLHLYIGLFISPFLLVFAVSVLFLNHARVDPARWTRKDIHRDVRLPAGLDATGPAAIPPARDIASQIGVTGEIGSPRFIRPTRRFLFTVSKPGVESTVDLDVDSLTAVVTRRTTGALEAMAYLHKTPGPHNANIRGNWIWTQVWRVFADATVYLALFVTISGVYLWFVLTAERTIGVALLAAGALSLFSIVYAVVR